MLTYYVRYGCKFRPFHGGEIAAIKAAGLEAELEPREETPTGYLYSLRVSRVLPVELRKHFDLVLFD